MWGILCKLNTKSLVVNLSNVKNYDDLMEFQALFFDKKLAPENHVFFHALRVSNFLSFAKKNLTPPYEIMLKLSTLQTNIIDLVWQPNISICR
jgi:hypothetical protein